MNLFYEGQLIQVKRELDHRGENDVATIENMYKKKGRKSSMNYEISMASLRFRETGKTGQFKVSELVDYFEPYTPTLVEEINTFFNSDSKKQSWIKRLFSFFSKNPDRTQKS